MWEYRKNIRSPSGVGGSFGNSHPRDSVESRLSLEELYDEASRVLRHRDGGVSGAVIPTTGEEIDCSGSVDASFGANHAALFGVGRRVDDDSVQGCALLDVVQGDAVSGSPQIEEVNARIFWLDQPGLVDALGRSQIFRVG